MKIINPYKNLRADSSEEVKPRQVPGAHYSYVKPTPVKSPEYLCWSKSMARAMGAEDKKKEWLNLLSGIDTFKEVKPVATRYGGHQFGHWAGQLGDGRAISLGAIEKEGHLFEIQLKGAGLTPYSRTADGRAVLRSSLREYICSEAMANLNVPTTRALSLVTTGEEVLRDMFYDGHPAYERGAICSRIAPSFLRFGHFQIHAAMGEKDELKELLSYTLENFFPEKSVEEFFLDVVNKTAFMIAQWYRVGFVHGVMNTDNMSILGLTIDYGPYGWLDLFDPDWTPNTTDFSQRRYRFMNQHNIAYWNLAQLNEALTVLGHSLDSQLERFPELFTHHFSEMMRGKLGMETFDDKLTNRLYNLLNDLKGDMTLFYRHLMKFSQGDSINWQDCFYKDLSTQDNEMLEAWLADWKRTNTAKTHELMAQHNPVFIPRNYIIQLALDDLEKGDEETLRSLERAIESPYEENEDTLKYFCKRPEWAATRPGCSTLSCSS